MLAVELLTSGPVAATTTCGRGVRIVPHSTAGVRHTETEVTHTSWGLTSGTGRPNQHLPSCQVRHAEANYFPPRISDGVSRQLFAWAIFVLVEQLCSFISG